MKKIKMMAPLLCVALALSCSGCTSSQFKDNLLGIPQNQNNVGDLKDGGHVTAEPPKENNKHLFGEAVTIDDGAAFAVTQYTIHSLTRYDSIYNENFSSSDFSDYTFENGWMAEDLSINHDYCLVVIDFTLKNIRNGTEKNEPIGFGNWTLNAIDETNSVNKIGELSYISFEQNDTAKRSDVPGDFFSVFLNEGSSVNCKIGYFIEASKCYDANELLLMYSVNPENTQYFYQK